MEKGGASNDSAGGIRHESDGDLVGLDPTVLSPGAKLAECAPFLRVGTWTVPLPNGFPKYRRDGSGSRILAAESYGAAQRPPGRGDLPETSGLLQIWFHEADYAVDGDDSPTVLSPTKPANDRATTGLRAPIPYRRYGW